MAELSEAERKAISAVFQRDASQERQQVPLTKADLQAAINAIDTWVNSNAVSFNAAIPLPARTSLSAKQKAELLFRVVRKRFEVS